jgi:glutamine cyclotransferase
MKVRVKATAGVELVSSVQPSYWKYKIVNTYLDIEAYTQGLEFYRTLYEGTGNSGLLVEEFQAYEKL